MLGCGPKPDVTLIDPAGAPAAAITIADVFAYPLGDGKKLTAAKDRKDDWFNALDVGADDHLGEDWNKNWGGNTDCGEPVYAAANGVVSYSGDAGPGWGNVVIVTHSLPDGSRVQTLYGHLREILKTDGEVKIREKIGTIGNANGKYLCHLHFELREESSPMWDKAGPGYASDRSGWLDPSDFIDRRLDGQ
jgi:murein DD-endopeptidase MepM/ murein hydrolase activator NlpD